jgi:Pyruvate/2-oxoacid:ferredoxin oxidoreductase delta subunit
MNGPYKRLAEKLDSLPNGFPATKSGIELKILRKIFSPEEAETAAKLKPFPETAAVVAERLGKSEDEMEDILKAMAQKGQIVSTKIAGQRVFILFPFVFGIFEFQEPRLDKELADMMEEYAPTFIPALGGHKPAVMRVQPLNIQIDAEHEVLAYEDLRGTMEKAKAFQVAECICRKEQGLRGSPCEYDTEVCLAFSDKEGAYDDRSHGRIISRDEALAILKKADEDGLVHATYNVKNGQMFVCNCCTCCCGMLRGMKHYNVPGLMAKSNFVASIDNDTCAACGVCADERCPVGAVSEADGVYAVQPDRCIGCGVCLPSCPTESISLIRKEEADLDDPPDHLLEWYLKRAENRGVKIAVD